VLTGYAWEKYVWPLRAHCLVSTGRERVRRAQPCKCQSGVDPDDLGGPWVNGTYLNGER
jgi:hypothetical protein